MSVHDLLAMHQSIEQKEERVSLFSRVARGVTSVGVFAGSVVAKTFFSSYSAIRAFSPVGMGASAFTLVDAVVPRKYKYVVDQLGREAIRLSIPLYFLLTQLYLNAETEEEQQGYIDSIMGLYGVQLAVLVRNFATFHFKLQEHQELLPREEENKKTFVLLGESSPLQKRAKSAAMFVIGVSSFASAWAMESQENIDAARSFGAFFMLQSLAIELWNPIEKKLAELEKKYEENLRQSPEGLKIPQTLRAKRVLERIIRLSIPISMGILLSDPNPYTMGLTGLFHGIADEMNNYAFSHTEISKVRSVMMRQLTQKEFYLDTGWKVMRVVGEAGGLSYFGYLVFSSGDPVYNVAIGSFLASITVGFASTALVSHRFRPERSSPLMTTLFFRTMESPEIGGIYPLYIYVYSIKNIKIGNDALNHDTLRTGVLTFIIWGSYGYSMGQEMAQYESNRYGPEPTRIPMWLLLSSTLTFIDRLKGYV